jgi:serine/threonine protein kinase/ABC-type branched-subunit amino acid transport system substrate-binding protein
MDGNRVGERFGDYRLLKRLGGGGFGEVYLGEHIHNHRSAAIKVLNVRLTSEADLKAFLDEARIIRFNHNHIVHLLDFNVAHGIPYIVMDYAPGGTIRDLHPRNTRVPLLDVVSYVLAIAAALQYAHYEHNTLHRDVKPANMLIDKNNNILLSDFGIAIVLDNTPSPHTPLVPLGSPSYMAPEQIQGRPNKASDQYALAICAYEWLTGNCPFFKGSNSEIQEQHISAQPPSLCSQVPGLSVEVEQVVLKALAKNPKDRYKTVQDFATALEQAVDPHQPIINPAPQPASAVHPQPAPVLPPQPASAVHPQSAPILPPQPAPAAPTRAPVLLPQLVLPPLALPQSPPPVPVLRIAFAVILILLLLGTVFLYEITRPPTPPPQQLYSPIIPSKTNDAGIGIKLIPFGTATLQIGIVDSKSPVFTSNEYTESNYRSNGEQCIDATNAQQKSQNVFTVIAVTTLSKINDSVSLTIGNEELQGICLWQQHNLKAYPLRILIANIGTKDTNVLSETVPEVTQQIVQFAKNNKNFLGVVGFSFSQSVSDGMDALNKADIPVVSPAASSANFASHKWSYFYRIVPNASTEGSDAAAYARNTLQAQQAFVFSDPANDYSGSLGEQFSGAFGPVNITSEIYSVKDDATQAFAPDQILKLSTYLTQASIPPTVIFCACYASDFSMLRKQLPDKINKNIFFMGGEALYELGAYTDNYANIYFTAFSFPDTIQKQCMAAGATQCQQEQLQFSGDYCQQFSSDIKADCKAYDTGGRPGPHAIQAYDAIYALLQAYTQAKKKADLLSRESVQQAFSRVSFQGISGYIDFKNAFPASDPYNKAVLVLCVDGNHQTHMLDVYGQFLNSSPVVQYDPYTICQ